MANIDSQINDRISAFSGNPQALMQRYAQTQELVDLLALQKMNNDRKAATAAVQSAMQPPTGTVKGQLEQQAMQGARNDVLKGMAAGIQQQGARAAQMQQRAAMGLPAQAAPNMARMANGGIVGYAKGGPAQSSMLTETQQYLDAQRTLNDPNTSQQEKIFAQGVLDSLRPVQQGGNVDPNIYAQMRQQLEKIRAARAGEKTDTKARGFQEGGLAALANDESRFGVEDDELTPEEARALDLERRDVGMVYGLSDIARDIQRAISNLPTPRPIPEERLIRLGMPDVTGSFTPEMVQQRQEELEQRIEQLPPEERIPREEEAAPTRPGTPNLMPPEPTMAQRLMQLPRVPRAPREQERQRSQIDFDKLMAVLEGGAGKTSTAGALAGGARGLREYKAAEQARTDKIAQALAELQLKRDLAANDARMLSARLAAEYQGRMDAEAFKVAQAALEDTRDPLNQEFQALATEIRNRYKRQPVVMETALDNLSTEYVNKAVERARQAVGVGGSPTTGISVRDLGLE